MLPRAYVSLQVIQLAHLTSFEVLTSVPCAPPPMLFSLSAEATPHPHLSFVWIRSRRARRWLVSPCVLRCRNLYRQSKEFTCIDQTPRGTLCVPGPSSPVHSVGWWPWRCRRCPHTRPDTSTP